MTVLVVTPEALMAQVQAGGSADAGAGSAEDAGGISTVDREVHKQSSSDQRHRQVRDGELQV